MTRDGGQRDGNRKTELGGEWGVGGGRERTPRLLTLSHTAAWQFAQTVTTLQEDRNIRGASSVLFCGDEPLTLLDDDFGEYLPADWASC